MARAYRSGEPDVSGLHESILWGVVAYDYSSTSVICLFTTEAEARKYAVEGEYDVEEFTLYTEAPASFTLWIRVAEIYPDGSVSKSSRTERVQPPSSFPPVDNDLGGFDGHNQGHCGEHLYVSGTDREAVERVFQGGVARYQGSGRWDMPREDHT